MTILFVGNTLADFLADSSSAGLIFNTDTTHRDSAFVPNDIKVPVQQTGSNPFSIVNTAEVTDFWIHFRYRSGRMFVNGVNGFLLEFKDGSGNTIGYLDAFQDGLRATARGDTTDNGPAYDMPSFGSFTIDCHVTVSASNITVEYYSNGSLASSVTVANTVSGYGGVLSCVFASSNVSYDSRDTYFSEIIATSAESTQGWRLACLEPDGVGFHSDFVGDFAALGDADVATAAGTDTALDKVSSTVTYGGPASPAGIRAIISKVAASRGATGPANLKHFLRISAVDYEGAANALSISNANYMEIWANNPATASPWNTADLTGIQVGIKAET